MTKIVQNRLRLTEIDQDRPRKLFDTVENYFEIVQTCTLALLLYVSLDLVRKLPFATIVSLAIFFFLKNVSLCTREESFDTFLKLGLDLEFH